MTKLLIIRYGKQSRRIEINDTNTAKRTKNGSWTRNNEQKAKTFADYLEYIFQPNKTQTNVEEILRETEEEEIT